MEWFLIGGYFLIMLASAVEAFCSFSRSAQPRYQPGIMKTPFRWVFEVLWVILLVVGGVSMLIDAIFSGAWYLFVIAIALFWLVLPLAFAVIIKRIFLPSWDEVKKELKPIGYTEQNYRRGSWWKKEAPSRGKKNKES